MKLENKSLPQLKRQLDKVFSEYIRRSNANWKDEERCYTCDKVDHWKNMQCGHFVSRAKLNTRFDEDNVRIQCMVCNVFKHGNYPIFAERLIREKGEKEISRLNRKGKKSVRFSKQYYIKMIKKYQNKIKKL